MSCLKISMGSQSSLLHLMKNFELNYWNARELPRLDFILNIDFHFPKIIIKISAKEVIRISRK